MATLTCVLGRLGSRNLFSSVRCKVQEFGRLSHPFSSTTPLWAVNVFTPCRNCSQLLSTNKSGFRSNTFLSSHIRHFIRRSEKGKTLTPRSKLQHKVDLPGNQRFSSLIRPFVFTTAVCVGSFTGAMVWQYETMRYHAQRIMRQANNPFTERPMHMKKLGFREHISTMWSNLSKGERMVCGIIAANLVVFLMWRIPTLTPFMTTYFCSSPTSSAPCLSMLLSTFSHINLLHLAANMYVLWSFSSIALSLLGKEQFMAVYLSAGTVSSFTSYAAKIARCSFTPSLGASGALMAVLGAVCISFPDSKLAIAFIGDIFPHSFSADSAMKALITFDTAGLIMGWKLFDHAAHLGGILFGLWYIKFGRDLIWGNRESVMEAWHNLRGKP